MMNYLLERHNILKTWEGSPYPVSWADVFYPPLCVLLSLTGVVLMVISIAVIASQSGLTKPARKGPESSTAPHIGGNDVSA